MRVPNQMLVVYSDMLSRKTQPLHQFLLALLNVNSVSTQLRKVNNKGLVQKSKIGASKVTLNIPQLIPAKLAQSGEHHTGTQEV